MRSAPPDSLITAAYTGAPSLALIAVATSAAVALAPIEIVTLLMSARFGSSP